jgi:hypothetical protein
MRTRKALGALMLGAFFVAAAQQQSRPSSESKGAVQTQMHNVVYHFTPTIMVRIRDLGGELLPAGGYALPVFDDKRSFTLRITAAEIDISQQSLANALNSYVFAAKDAPLKNISVLVEDGRLKIKGKLHSKGDVPFEVEGSLTSTEDGKIRLHSEKIRALHLPIKGLMDLFSLDIADLIKNGKVSGVEAEKDDIILDPGQILPPPHISGRVTGVRLQGGSIVLVFGDLHKYPWVRFPVQNYMALRGNRLRFGKLTMDDTDMLLIDMDPADPFDFFLDHYVDQLVAGYTKIKKDNGLRVFMKDYDKLFPTRK